MKRRIILRPALCPVIAACVFSRNSNRNLISVALDAIFEPRMQGFGIAFRIVEDKTGARAVQLQISAIAIDAEQLKSAGARGMTGEMFDQRVFFVEAEWRPWIEVGAGEPAHRAEAPDIAPPFQPRCPKPEIAASPVPVGIRVIAELAL